MASLQLWTFQVNDRARRFYERNGFTIAEMTDGAGNQEREPDIRYSGTLAAADAQEAGGVAAEKAGHDLCA